MKNHTCYCETTSDQTCCNLRAQLTIGHECPSLAPWERELYAMAGHEPNVDLSAHLAGGTVLDFTAVRGISIKDGTLTFEDNNGRLYFVPGVAYWTTDASDD